MNTRQSDREPMERLVARIRRCRLCEEQLPLGPRPVLQAHAGARLLIAGQAPGAAVHKSGKPFADPSGDRLREWMGIDEQTFYDPECVAIVPMGFCYPGKAKSGDLPPITRCASEWRKPLLSRFVDLRLTLLIGQYAQKWHLRDAAVSVTDTVRRWREFPDDLIPLPHPSPRNNVWLSRNPWFEKELVSELRERVARALG